MSLCVISVRPSGISFLNVAMRGRGGEMGVFFAAVLLLSLLFGLANGNMAEVTAAALGGGTAAVELSLELLGAMCLWSGLANVAERAGLTELLCSLLGPALKKLFTGAGKEKEALKAVSMNVAANLMGLGNAATPLGIEAMRRLQRANPSPGRASPDMVTFTVLNTASLQLLPTTVAMLRLGAGAQSPLDILPAVWLSSAVSVATGLLAARAMTGRSGG